MINAAANFLNIGFQHYGSILLGFFLRRVLGSSDADGGIHYVVFDLHLSCDPYFVLISK